jgi:ubiquinone/menaquinone biosynthesis C-methylase UbiE
MRLARSWWRWAGLTALSAGTAYAARWLRDAVDARARVRVPALPAVRDPAGARAEQRLADGPLWAWAEGRLVRQALTPFRVRPALRPLRILNLGHGPGGIACALAQQAPQDATVVATDAVAGMAELARERARRRGLRWPGPRFVRAAPAALPFREGAFGLVLSGGALHDWRDPQGALAEVGRVLAPDAGAGGPPGAAGGGGRYLIADLRRDVSFPVWLLIRLVQSLGAPGDLRALDEPSASYRAAFSRDEAEWLAARAKLPDLHVRAAAAWLMIERRAVSPQAIAPRP